MGHEHLVSCIRFTEPKNPANDDTVSALSHPINCNLLAAANAKQKHKNLGKLAVMMLTTAFSPFLKWGCDVI